MLPSVVITSASTARSSGMPATANPVASGGCACTTALTSGRLRYTSRCISSSDEGSRSPEIFFPARSVTTIISGVMNPFETLFGVVRSRAVVEPHADVAVVAGHVPARVQPSPHFDDAVAELGLSEEGP